MKQRSLIIILAFLFAVTPLLGAAQKADASNAGSADDNQVVQGNENGEENGITPLGTDQDVLSASDMKALIEQLAEEGEFENDQAVHALTLHLTAVSHYEQQDKTAKFIKHMKGFKVLLDHQKENGLISDHAYNTLKTDANALIEKWNSLVIIKDGQAQAVIVAPNDDINTEEILGWGTWNKDKSSDGYSKLALDVAHFGDASVLLNKMEHGNLNQKFDVQPGPFEFKVYYYTSSKGKANIQLTGNLRDEHNDTLKTISTSQIPTADTTGKWHAITFKGDIPEEVDGKEIKVFQALIGIKNQDNVPVYVDDASFSQEEEGDNLLENPGFETMVSKAPIPGWGTYNKGASNGSSNLVQGIAHSGDLSIAIHRMENGNMNQTFHVQPGSYEFKVYYFTPSSSNAKIHLSGNLRDSNNKTVKSISGSKSVKTSDTAGKWNAITFTVDIPEKTEGKEIKIFQALIWIQNGDTVPVYLDDVSFSREDQNDNLVDNPGFEEVDYGKPVEELRKYVEKSTGATIPVVNEREWNKKKENFKGDIPIYIGDVPSEDDSHVREQLKDLDDQGFLIDPKKDHVTIIGPTKWGTLNGVYEFLERYVGVRWLMPSEAGEDVPQLTNIFVPKKEIRDEPSFRFRELSPLRGDPNQSGPRQFLYQWAGQNKLQGHYDEPIKFHHNLYTIFPVEKYGKTHPEFYPDDNPSPDGKKKWQPCFTVKGTVDVAVSSILDYFDANPDATTFSLGINDNRNFCEADPDHPHYPGKTNSIGLVDMSDIYFKWVNEVVEQVREVYPDKWFGLLAYSNVMDPPSFKLNSHVVPFITKDRMTWIDDDIREASHERIDAWNEVASQIGWYDYAYGALYALPRVYPHEMAEYYRYAENHNVFGIYTEMYFNAGDGPKAWLSAKLQWNPDQDVDALLDEWYTRTVGHEAAPYLKAYYDLWENFWTIRIKDSEWFKGGKGNTYLPFKDASYIDLVTDEDLSESQRLMEKVVAKADTPEQEKRADILMRTFEYYKASVLSYPKKGKVDTPENEQSALDLLDDIKQSLDMGQKRHDMIKEFDDTPALAFTRNPRDFIEDWSGVQRSEFYALEDYVAAEPESGEVGKRLEEFLEGLPGAIRQQFIGSGTAVKTAAGRENILQSLDFSRGPWKDADPITNFRIMEEPTQKPSVDTKVYLLWDDENLYVGYENFDSDLPPKAKMGDWHGNSDQTILTGDPQGTMTGYFTNPDADQYFYKQEPGSGPQAGTNNEWKTATRMGSDRWNTVQVIPFTSIGMNSGETDTVWSLFFRYYNDESELIGWGGGHPWVSNDLLPVHLVEKE